MGRFVLYFMLLTILFHSLQLKGQEITIINNFSGSDTEAPIDNYVLGKVTQHTYIVNDYEPIQSGARAQVEQMVRYGLRSYIDNKYYSIQGRVVALDSKETFSSTASAIVRNALWIHDYDFHDKFNGFSNSVSSKAAELKTLNGFRLSEGDRTHAVPQNGAVDIYTFQRMVYDLKVAAEKEISLFLDVYMVNIGNDGSELAEKPGLLDPLDFSINGKVDNLDNLNSLKPVPLPRDIKGRKNKKDNKGTTGLDSEIVRLLEDNNRILSNYGNRFSDLQTQIDEIRSDRNLTATILREEMAALREMMKTFMVSSSRPSETAVSTGTLTATLVFEKNAHQLTSGHKAQLNRVEIDLKVDQSLLVLVTGFADKTGNTDFNAWLSEQRANAVYQYLLVRKIPEDRIVVNYLGDIESRYANPADRKVEISYIKPSVGK